MNAHQDPGHLVIDEDGLSSEGQVKFSHFIVPCLEEIVSGPHDDVSVGRGLRHELPQRRHPPCARHGQDHRGQWQSRMEEVYICNLVTFEDKITVFCHQVQTVHKG